jgi:DNA-binding transcriptional ArsR family regulator
MKIEQLQKQAASATDLLKVMASRSRLLVLCQLLDGEKSVHDLEQKLKMRQSTLSQHLAILRREKFVKTRREAQFIYYALARDEIVTVLEALYSIYCAPKKAR